MVDSVTDQLIPVWHTRFFELFKIVIGRSLKFGIWIEMQAILFTNSVGDMSKLKPILFIIHHSLAVNKRNTVDNEVTMQMMSINMASYNHLIPLAPSSASKLHSNLLRFLRSDVLLLEAHISVIGLNTICLTKIFFGRYELVTGS